MWSEPLPEQFGNFGFHNSGRRGHFGGPNTVFQLIFCLILPDWGTRTLGLLWTKHETAGATLSSCLTLSKIPHPNSWPLPHYFLHIRPGCFGVRPLHPATMIFVVDLHAFAASFAFEWSPFCQRCKLSEGKYVETCMENKSKQERQIIRT